MYMMGNRVQSLSHKVSSIIHRWHIGAGKVRTGEMYSCEIVSSVNVLSSRIVDSVGSNIDTGCIICHKHYRDCVTNLHECVEV